MLFALLQLHVAHPDNLAHEADAGPDEVSAAEVLKEQRAHKGVPLCHPVTSAYFLMLKDQNGSSLLPTHPRTVMTSGKNDWTQNRRQFYLPAPTSNV